VPPPNTRGAGSGRSNRSHAPNAAGGSVGVGVISADGAGETVAEGVAVGAVLGATGVAELGPQPIATAATTSTAVTLAG
jgi:hypothetical protein